MGRILTATAVTLFLVIVPSSRTPGSEQAMRNSDHVDPVPDAVFIPTPHDIVARMLELASVGKTDVVYDLGCGDGRIAVAAAKHYGCRSAGFDIDANRVKQSLENVQRARLQSLVVIEHRDVLEVDLRPATVIMVYLSARHNGQLRPQFEKLKPGSRIVSHQFDMRGVPPDKVVQVISRDDGRTHTLYLWRTPLKTRD